MQELLDFSNKEPYLELKIKLNSNANEEKFLDTLAKEAIEANNLAIGGNPLASNGSAITAYDNGSLTNCARDNIKEWLDKHNEVIDYYLSSIVH